MNAFENPLSRRNRPSVGDKLATIKRIARETLSLPEDVQVSVSELKCHEPGCPDVETVVVVMKPGEPNVMYRVHKPLLEVAAEDICNAINP